ncbi:hypothetical protein LCGC14_2893070 [marine sediment metagenome]|uniref:Uncharacterized protein n=1 Tax=marine sediment metagenome TaxID=412755 RepID=A0A0F9AMU0_9ZZZZ
MKKAWKRFTSQRSPWIKLFFVACAVRVIYDWYFFGFDYAFRASTIAAAGG